jgi:hypothetical protein
MKKVVAIICLLPTRDNVPFCAVCRRAIEAILDFVRPVKKGRLDAAQPFNQTRRPRHWLF